MTLLHPLPHPAFAAHENTGGTSSHQRLARWRADDHGFAAWQHNGTSADGILTLDIATARQEQDPFPTGEYQGRSFYNGGAFAVGEATSPVIETPFGATEAIASWGATTPSGSWIEVLARAQQSGSWSDWYNLGVWAANDATVARHSVEGQRDNRARVATDTLELAQSAQALQLKIRLFSEGETVPQMHSAALLASAPGALPPSRSGNPALWNQVLDVPTCSQMLYPDGRGWCSPTSVGMILGYWQPTDVSCEYRVRTAVAGTYDWIYDGTGNWPFNVAYAAAHGLEAYVARLPDLFAAEEWIAAGVPVVISIAWDEGTLANAPLNSSKGHLMVLVGFDGEGNPVMNDPAGVDDSQVRRTYLRHELEGLWRQHSNGTVYLIYPPEQQVPNLS